MTLDPSLVLGAGAAVMYAGWALFQKQAVVTLEGSEAPIFIFLFAVRTSNLLPSAPCSPSRHTPPRPRSPAPIRYRVVAAADSGAHSLAPAAAAPHALGSQLLFTVLYSALFGALPRAPTELPGDGLAYAAAAGLANTASGQTCRRTHTAPYHS